jgi:hypothetical protein
VRRCRCVAGGAVLVAWGVTCTASTCQRWRCGCVCLVGRLLGCRNSWFGAALWAM